MPRKRMIDPEFWSDEEISQWSYAARLFYIGLWNFSDDEGRFKAHKILLKSQIFPYDTKINMDDLIKEVSIKIQWYSHNDCQYGFVRNFLKHQSLDRPSKSKLPPPPLLDEDSTNTHRGLAVGSILIEEKRIEENRSKNTSAPSGAQHVPTNPQKEEKQSFFTHVYLLPSELLKLQQRFGEEDAEKRIRALNNYIGSKGKKYKSHYHTILTWADLDAKREGH